MAATLWQKCSKCNEGDFLDLHQCKDAWLAIDLGDGEWDADHASKVRADDAEGAAMAFARKMNEDEGCVVRWGSVNVAVAPADHPKEVTRWRVAAEMTVTFFADPLDGE